MIGSYLLPNISLQEELDAMSVIDGLDSVSFGQAELQQSLAMCSLAWHIYSKFIGSLLPVSE